MAGFQHLFLDSENGATLIQGSYSWGLVLLSLFVAMFSATMAMHTAKFARNAERSMHRHLAVGIGAISLGGGVWTMHFIGMMAFELCSQVSYASSLTLLSSIPGLAASWFALWLLSRRDPGAWRLILAGTLVGAGIGAMHYSGMAAMRFAGALRYEPYAFACSIVVAMALATFALWLRYGLRRYTRLGPATRLVISGCVMGLAIAGMHYIGMSAARFVGNASTANNVVTLNTAFVSLALSTFTITVTVLVSALTGLMNARELYRKMEEGQLRLRSILDTAVDGIITIDSRGLIQSFSQSAEHMFGWLADEVIGRNIKMLMPEPDKSRHDGYLDNYLWSGAPKVIGTGREVMGMCKDGSLIPMRLAVGRVDLPNELLFVGFVTDITERHDLEVSLRETAERAERAVAAKSIFLANMSHEIRTPMNSIIGFTELLLKDPLTDTQRSHLGVIRQSSRSLLGLLNDILDTTRLEKDGMALESIDFSLKGLAYQIENSLRLSAQAKSLAFIVDYPDDMPEYFQGDPLRVQQVLTNLLGNAIKFTEQGSVRLALSYRAGKVRADISDTGIGMSKEQVESIFTLFTQADASISRRFGGTGLGTTIARQLVELMGGAIGVESKLGQGSVFHVQLPLPVGRKPNPVKIDMTHATLPSLSILVADDVPQNLELVRLLLEDGGHKVATASNGEAAVKRFAEGYFDLVLMDVHMPGVDGLQATRRIREIERGSPSCSPVPIIALTASVMAQDQREARHAGMDGFAVKPLDPAQLMAEILHVMHADRTTPAAAAADAAKPGAPVLINWTAGILLWGSESRLVNAIGNFLGDVHERHPLPDRNQAGVDWNAVRFSLHSIRGAAGNLAMPAVHELAARLETLVRDGKGEAARVGFPELYDLLAAASRELLNRPLAARTAPKAAPTLSPAEFQAAMLDLLEHFERNECPDDLVQTVCDTLAGQDAVYAKALRTAIDNFEFSPAQAILQQAMADRTVKMGV